MSANEQETEKERARKKRERERLTGTREIDRQRETDRQREREEEEGGADRESEERYDNVFYYRDSKILFLGRGPPSLAAEPLSLPGSKNAYQLCVCRYACTYVWEMRKKE